MKEHQISTAPLTIDQIELVISSGAKLVLSEEATQKIQHCRNYLDQKIKTSDEPIYGINTGFGSLYKERISKSELSKLQTNIIKSHACGAGDAIPTYIVKIILLLKVQSLSYGHSGVQVSTVQRLIDFYTNNVLPLVYEYGSLGASGDLAPLAHICLPLIGEGEVNFKGNLISGKELNKQMGWQPIKLQAKEGLALLNGTQFMAAFGVWNLIQSKRILSLSNLIGALSIDAFDGRIEPFNAKVHAIRPQPGQGIVAKEVRNYLAGSELITQQKQHVQDPYSFRCIPQVHGATNDALTYVNQVFTNEINGVTDNPNVFPNDDLIISAGNFHGQPLALALDFMALAVAELGSISERRTYQLISGSRDLPNYLVANPGINSGLMIPQYTAASIVSQNKNLCHPATADSIVSSNGQEDHVSMGANAATKAHKIINNLFEILGIEMITASQALELRRPLRSSPKLEELVSNFRKEVPFIKEDRILHNDMVKATQFLKNYSL
ncbi:MAG: histidine ammonia-lyase [Cyclobacteriaceae bacterium]|nr:histidine ammonia-lyase [Cyclobacteriaceae bacterium]